MKEPKVAHGASGCADVERIARGNKDDAQTVELSRRRQGVILPACDEAMVSESGQIGAPKPISLIHCVPQQESRPGAIANIQQIAAELKPNVTDSTKPSRP